MTSTSKYIRGLVTVIIPTYNNETTIRRAIDSVISQKYTDWELIVVNDKSTDNTSKILKEYKNNLGNKITIIENKENIGCGLSRRKALRQAKGEFCTFLDSDDELLPEFIITDITIQKQQNAEIVYSCVTIRFPSEYKMKDIQQHYEETIMTGSATIQTQIDPNTMKFVTGKLYKTELFEKFDFSSRREGEDIETLFKACYYAKSVRSTNFCGYIHHYRHNSLLADKDLFFRYATDAIVTLAIIEFMLNEHQNVIAMHFIERTCYYYIGAINTVRTMNNITNKQLQENIDKWIEINCWIDKHRDICVPITKKIIEDNPNIVNLCLS